ncbi:MAG: capsular polysaccharide biosynthesis protein [Neisseriaceae bacterium]|nr:capsular polysaccharide biosynthesis protein [Neisseriaceae bacterium]
MRATRQHIRLGWGRKLSGERARRIAADAKATFCLLEDGFLRSVGLGVEGHPPLALVVDEVGIYYDATTPSQLENLIKDHEHLAPLMADAQAAWDLVVAYGLSKYNHAPEAWPEGLAYDASTQNILIIDQTVGDMALQYGGADASTFAAMFAAAQAEHPNATLWVKTHPDVLSGKKQGYLTQLLQQPQVRVISADISPLFLLGRMDAVYTVTSQMGFEALLLGKPVTTFGLPWYAGWGVCDDRHEGIAALRASGRRTQASVLTLFAAAYLAYSRYLNPYTGAAGTIFDVIDYLQQMKQRQALLAGTVLCVGLSWWKRVIVKPFLSVPKGRLLFKRSLAACQRQAITPDTKVLVWGQKQAEVTAWAVANSLPVLRMEDGFIRSVGLGSNLVPPLSLVIDDVGIYFDATEPSRLEQRLEQGRFSPMQLAQAARLREGLVRLNVGKYNVGEGGLQLPSPRPAQVILVPGQVEDDASIAYGSPVLKRNFDLLRAVRERHPEAYIIFKPHPDVVSGNRVGGPNQAEALTVADQVVVDADVLACIQSVDEVHTMTSLTGFEALLRGKKVACYGAPFYAGWGLTEDHVPLPRRTRQLVLDELVAGTLLYYPTYVHPKTGRLLHAAQALALVAEQKQDGKRRRTQYGRLAKKRAQWGALLSVLCRIR